MFRGDRRGYANERSPMHETISNRSRSRFPGNGRPISFRATHRRSRRRSHSIDADRRVDRRRRGQAAGATPARPKRRPHRSSGGYVSPIEEAGPTEAVDTAQGRGGFTFFPPTTHQGKTQDPPSETTMNNATQDAGFDTSSWITLRWTRGTRYYRVHLEQDLWSAWILTSVNGRSGTPLGRARCQPAPTIEAALLNLAHIAKRRRQRGYELMR